MEWKQFVDEKYLPTMEKYHKARRINPTDAPRNYEFDFIDCKYIKKYICNRCHLYQETKKSLISLQDVTERNIAENKLKNSLKIRTYSCVRFTTGLKITCK